MSWPLIDRYIKDLGLSPGIRVLEQPSVDEDFIIGSMISQTGTAKMMSAIAISMITFSILTLSITIDDECYYAEFYN
jgi:hypothetical protein